MINTTTSNANQIEQYPLPLDLNIIRSETTSSETPNENTLDSGESLNPKELDASPRNTNALAPEMSQRVASPNGNHGIRYLRVISGGLAHTSPQNSMVCPECGFQAIDEDDRYCEMCGAKLVSSSDPAANTSTEDNVAVDTDAATPKHAVCNNPIHENDEPCENHEERIIKPTNRKRRPLHLKGDFENSSESVFELEPQDGNNKTGNIARDKSPEQELRETPPMPSTHCPVCNGIIGSHDRFCGWCGSTLWIFRMHK